ncbi:MAG: MFS transporter [Cellulomonadaceae bacterium]|jgi:MFS family permease|nr:MFS transporter [Cellulomonadaceae bacterium]
MAAVAWGGNEFTPLLVMYRADGLGAVTVDGLLAAYVVGIVPALLLGGPLSDRYGRRPLMLPAAPISAVGSVILALGSEQPVLLGIGRVLCGIALGLVMAVGTTWVTELSAVNGQADDGARRASLALTGGFLLGAAVASLLAQWGPWPTRLPYLSHVVLAVVAAIGILPVGETRMVGDSRVEGAPDSPTTSLLSDLRVPAVAHRRFLRVVLPSAPWVFACVGVAYAVLPGLLAKHAGSAPIAFAGLMTVLTLGCGIGIQVVARKIDTHRSARATMIAMSLIVVGLALGAWAADALELPLGLVAAAILGVGYGLALVAGLSEVARIAGPDQLAGLTAVYYSVAYLGFFVPMILAWLSTSYAYWAMLGVLAVVAVACLGLIAASSRRHLPVASA